MARLTYGLLAALVLAGLMTSAVVAQSANPHTLVLVDDLGYDAEYSNLFDILRSAGHELTIRHVYARGNKLGGYGEFTYDNLVILAPSAEDFGDHIAVEDIVKFVDSGRNVFVAVDDSISQPLRDLANECGIDFDEEGTRVIDNFSYDTLHDEGMRTRVVASSSDDVSVITGPGGKPIVYSGIGHASGDVSRLLFKVLTGNPTTYSHVPAAPIDGFPQSTGSDTLLVTSIQTRNNARVSFSGSMSLCSNEFFTRSVQVPGSDSPVPAGNREFCQNLVEWTFKERGMLRVAEVEHQKVDVESEQTVGEVNPGTYRIKDHVSFTAHIQEWTGQSWETYKGDDVQLEFIMLDPYVRQTLGFCEEKDRHVLWFQAPDVYGVFKFSIAYHRVGYSNLEYTQQVSVRPFHHDEYERFIDVAFPYYVSNFVMQAAFVLFGFVFLLGKRN